MRAVTVVFVLVTVGSVGAEVMESRVPYDCTEEPKVKFNSDCNNSWNMNDQVFAKSEGSSTGCVSPCKKIEDGLMTLDSCKNVTVISHCLSNDEYTEHRIHYYSQSITAPPLGQGNQAAAGSVRPSPTAMLITGLFASLMIFML